MPPRQDETEHLPTGIGASRSPTNGTRLRALLPIYLRGLAMGAADIVPGVSGGTMALILGIYTRLITSLRSLARQPFLGHVGRGRVLVAFRSVDGEFLLALAAGIFTAVLLLANILHGALEARPVFVYAFFFGLILASVVLVARQIDRPGTLTWILFAIGTVSAFLLVGLTPGQTPDAPWFLFLSGALAVSALLLPGISGAFILVLLGKYEYVLEALTTGHFGALAVVALGALVGLLSFAQVLGWLFRRYHDATLAALCGVMLGSLRKVWPWQVESGGTTVNIAPPVDYLSTEHGLLWSLALALSGAAVVTLLERIGARSD